MPSVRYIRVRYMRVLLSMAPMLGRRSTLLAFRAAHAERGIVMLVIYRYLHGMKRYMDTWTHHYHIALLPKG